jgi:hypothetical protein
LSERRWDADAMRWKKRKEKTNSNRSQCLHKKKKGKIEKRIIISDFSTMRKSRILINK